VALGLNVLFVLVDAVSLARGGLTTAGIVLHGLLILSGLG
jgi:hypothetical protein